MERRYGDALRLHGRAAAPPTKAAAWYNCSTGDALTDCTISDNSAIERGGGLWNYGTATLTDCVQRRSTNEGGGVYLLSGPNSRTTIVGTIVAGNAAAVIGPDLFGTVTLDQGDNLVGEGSGASGLTAAGDRVGTAASPIDPLLAALGDYGGPTQTMALLPGSPAIGKGVAIAGLTADQRFRGTDSPNPTSALRPSPGRQRPTTEPARAARRSRPSASNRPGRSDRFTTTFTFDPTIFAAHQTIRAGRRRPARA